ncbi:MAG: hypothetical protein KY468_12160, partial [Armatimonadetes bacterium]|nr:hypothetical protein [Armatimonadota bacterium]
QSSQPLLSTPRLTVSGGCIAAATIPLNASGGGYVGAYIPPSGTSDCIVTFTATGTDALNRAAQSGSATLQLDLTPPVAQDQTLHIDEDGSIQVTLSATDTSRITYRIVDSPAHGALGVLSGDRITYTPKPNFFGTDRFTFKANDGKWDSAPATVTVTTHKVNDAPVAVNGSAVALPGQAVAATLTGTDIDGDGLAYSVVSPPAHGTLSGTAPDLRYTPNPGYVGSDSFSFRVNDGQADSNVGVFSINVVSPLLVVNSAEAVPGGTATLSLSLTEAAVRVTGLDLRLRVVGPVGSPEIVPTIMPGAQALGWILMPDPSDPLHFTLSGPALSGPAELAKFAFQVPETVAGGTVYTLQAETATLMEEGKPSTEVASLVQPGLFTVEDCGALLKGDGTGNGTLDVADVIFALRIAVDLEQPEPCQHMAADVDSNGVVALDDAVMLLRHIVMGEPLPTQNLGQ